MVLETREDQNFPGAGNFIFSCLCNSSVVTSDVGLERTVQALCCMWQVTSRSLMLALIDPGVYSKDVTGGTVYSALL